LITRLNQYTGISKRNGLRALQLTNEPCAISGSTSISLNDTNSNNIPDAGDRASITVNQCIDFVGGSTVSGAVDIVYNACTPRFNGGACDAQTVTVNITVSDASGSGTMVGSISSVIQNDVNFMMGSQSFTSSALSLTFGNENVSFYNLVSDTSWDNNLGTSSDASDFTIDINVTGFIGRLTVDNTVPMESSNFNFYPDTGSTTVTGAGGTTAVLNADTGDLNTVQVTTNGGAPQLFTWLELEQQSPIPALF